MDYFSQVMLLISFLSVCEIAHAATLRRRIHLTASEYNTSNRYDAAKTRGQSIEALVDAAAEKVMRARSRNVDSSRWLFNTTMKIQNSSFLSSGRYTMNGAVIFLHGEAQTAAEYRNTISGLVDLENMLIQNGFMPLFPDAELQQEPPSTEYRALWFVNEDGETGPGITEADWSMKRAYGKIIGPMIARMKEKYSVPVEKVIVGGYSRGGDMGLQMLRLNPDVGGFFSVAGYLPTSSAVYSAVSSASKTQPVFMSHGKLDDVVPYAWGNATANKLKANGANVEFTLRDNIGHWQDQITLALLQDWIVKTYENIWRAEDAEEA